MTSYNKNPWALILASILGLAMLIVVLFVQWGSSLPPGPIRWVPARVYKVFQGSYAHTSFVAVMDAKERRYVDYTDSGLLDLLTPGDIVQIYLSDGQIAALRFQGQCDGC